MTTPEHTPEHTPDFQAARWIWFPSQRCLQNTFVLFRKELDLDSPATSALGWVLADSRYRLWVNGRYVQRGPGPADPRWPEADPINLTKHLKVGKNSICIEVCYFGRGEGTWVAGAPGLLFSLEITGQAGQAIHVGSDDSWLSYLDRAHTPGLYSRWFLRSLQEVYDARLRPENWNTVEFTPDALWVAARELPGKSTSPAMFAGGPEYIMEVMDLNIWGGHEKNLGMVENPPAIRKRSIPMLRDTEMAEATLVDSGRLKWLRPADDWFESRVPGSFEIERHATLLTHSETVHPAAGESTYLTYAIPEQMVGWPRLVVDAPAGTTIDIMVQEGHDLENGPLWLDTHFFAWSRLICKEGRNEFECLDYESSKWIQLNIRNASRPVKIEWCGFRRREYPWAHMPEIRIGDEKLQALFDAQLNSIRNGCQDTVQDGGGRERQQYSGDCGHQLHIVRTQCGEPDISARFLRTFSQGMTVDGYFLDCWPGYDRLARLAQRQMGIAMWGPLLDHGIGFIFDNYHHWMETGRLEDLAEPYPRLVRFFHYLESIEDSKLSMLPVSDLGMPTVWLDHEAYTQKRHKQCAFNLYASAALGNALAPIAEAMGEPEIAAEARQLAERLHAGAVRAFWCPERKLFVDNLPWETEEGGTRLSDRALATAVIFGLNPEGCDDASIEALADCPETMGLSYPANVVWRFWALAKGGRMDVVWKDIAGQWATLPSIQSNNSIQEYWSAPPDDIHTYSHCPYAPLIILQHGVLGLQPLEPGFTRCSMRPDLRGLPHDLSVTYHTVRGEMGFKAVQSSSGWEISISIPKGMCLTLVLDERPEEFTGPATVNKSVDVKA
jgi:hypothetical protein